MAQSTKVIDLTRSYVPIDPLDYPNNYHDTQREDAPEDAAPVIAYEGHNFMPTDQGYKSYFGTNSKLGINSLTSKVDRLLMVQTSTFDNLLVALCADGIWVKKGTESGAWIQEIVLPESTEALHYEWTYCLLENTLFMYRQGSPVYWKLSSSVSANIVDAIPGPASLTVSTITGITTLEQIEVAVAYRTAKGWISAPSEFQSINATNLTVQLAFPALITTGEQEYIVYIKSANKVYKERFFSLSTAGVVNIWATQLGTEIELPDDTWLSDSGVDYNVVVPVTPTFLNMTGQLGVFAAGIRLGFWDSMNSISWSSIDDYADFTPSIQTLAGSAVFAAVSGRIVTIQGHGEGFIVYSTKAAVYIRKAVEATFQWDPKVLLNVGVSYPRQVAVAVPNTTHFAYTHTALYKIEEGREEVLVPTVYDYLKPLKAPVYLDLLEGRYLFLHIMDPDFLNSQVGFQVDTVPRTVITFPQDYQQEAISSPITLEGSDACYTLQGLNAGLNNSGATPVANAGFEFGPHWFSLYNAYYSFGGVPNELTWIAGCYARDETGTTIPTKPVGGSITNVSQDEIGKYVVQDTPELWYYRNNSEKFVATQLALWRLSDQARASFLAEILAFNEQYEDVIADSGTTYDYPFWHQDAGGYGMPYLEAADAIWPTVHRTVPVTQSYCDQEISIILEWSSPVWGVSPCGLYLTRYATKIGKLFLKTVIRPFGESEWGGPGSGWRMTQAGNPDHYGYGSPEDFRSIVIASHPSSSQDPDDWQWRMYNNTLYPRGRYYTKVFEHSTTFDSPASIFTYFVAGSYRYGKLFTYTLEIRDIQEGVFAVDTAYMELAGWYNSENYAQIVPAGADCKPPVQALPDKDPSSQGGTFPIDELDGTICGIPFDPISLPGLLDSPLVWPEQSVTLPAVAFLLQEGSVAPFYPTLHGALVYDLHLKKWGKLKSDYQHLFDYQPINGKQGNVVSFATFGMEAGLLTLSGDIYIFDTQPDDSYIKYGKIGYFRQGFTHCEEIRVQFAEVGDCKITMEASIDGRFPEVTLQQSTNLTNVMDGILLANTSARWYNIKVSGTYDLTYLEFRGTKGSRR